MSLPPKPKRRVGPLEIVSGWSQIYETIRAELQDRGVEQQEAAKVAAYVAASLVKEIDLGNNTREH
jgi:hypothetical protein